MKKIKAKETLRVNEEEDDEWGERGIGYKRGANGGFLVREGAWREIGNKGDPARKWAFFRALDPTWTCRDSGGIQAWGRAEMRPLTH